MKAPFEIGSYHCASDIVTQRKLYRHTLYRYRAAIADRIELISVVTTNPVAPQSMRKRQALGNTSALLD